MSQVYIPEVTLNLFSKNVLKELIQEISIREKHCPKCNPWGKPKEKITKLTILSQYIKESITWNTSTIRRLSITNVCYKSYKS